MAEEISKRDRTILELAERLEHDEIFKKHKLLDQIRAKSRGLQPRIEETGYLDEMRGWISALDLALATELILLRNIDNARRNVEYVDKKHLKDTLSEAESSESKAMDVLPKMFAKYTGMGVDKEAESLKTEIRRLILDYKRGSLKCFRRTRALLNKLN